MKPCKKYIEKLIFFDELNEMEKQDIQEHLKNCKECKIHFEQISALMTSLKNELNASHLSDEALVRYLIRESFPEETDYDGKKLSAFEVLKIKNHLQRCDACTTKIQEMRTEYKSLEDFINESEIENYVIGKNSIWTILNNQISSLFVSFLENLKNLSFIPKPKYVLIPATVIAVLLLLLLFLPIFNSNGSFYFKLGKLEKTEISYLTRGSNTNSLQIAISEFNKNNYSKVIGFLESFVLENPENPNRAFAEYVCGLAYLYQAEKANQTGDIDKGIEHLRSSLALNPNTRLQEDANWYIGKAYLKKENGQEAIQYFKRVKSLKGNRSHKAQRILLELEKNLISSK